jgi:hypothetical protein
MNKRLPILAALLGILFVAVAALYGLIPARSLPAFFPGFKAGSEHVRVGHALGSLVLALALFALAWFRSAHRAVTTQQRVVYRVRDERVVEMPASDQARQEGMAGYQFRGQDCFLMRVTSSHVSR